MSDITADPTSTEISNLRKDAKCYFDVESPADTICNKCGIPLSNNPRFNVDGVCKTCKNREKMAAILAPISNLFLPGMIFFGVLGLFGVISFTEVLFAIVGLSIIPITIKFIFTKAQYLGLKNNEKILSSLYGFGLTWDMGSYNLSFEMLEKVPEEERMKYYPSIIKEIGSIIVLKFNALPNGWDENLATIFNVSTERITEDIFSSTEMKESMISSGSTGANPGVLPFVANYLIKNEEEELMRKLLKTIEEVVEHEWIEDNMLEQERRLAKKWERTFFEDLLISEDELLQIAEKVEMTETLENIKGFVDEYDFPPIPTGLLEASLSPEALNAKRELKNRSQVNEKQE
ncbi:MAG: hypothetical protein KAR35_03130 [Candidatus Heimdallarchaeota archaeon]|nr:hypothetical protein [Candidatus Heimdallarchaeota archaeon]MCK5048349.1 hypothetical protein [Candidatus Heimdallarchaeota archaeon]